MLRTTFGGSPVREPEPRSIHDEWADDPEVSLCNYCGSEIAYSEEPAWCNEACREADEEYAAADAQTDRYDEAGV